MDSKTLLNLVGPPPSSGASTPSSSRSSSAHGLATSNHLSCALEAMNASQRLIRTVIEQRRLPDDPMGPASIQHFVAQLAMLDTNNFATHVGVGEREGRVFSSVVQHRHSYLSHGVGRSGELDAHQPKAAGSSLIYPLTNMLVLDSVRALGLTNKAVFEEALVVPLSTGMTLSLVLRSIANQLPGSVADTVVWCRIDQKTCLKCIPAAGLKAAVVNLRCAQSPKSKDFSKKAADEIQENHDRESTSPSPCAMFVQSAISDIRSCIESLPQKSKSVAAVLTTTSCFCPRLPDDILGISRLCRELDVPHVVNNAYGLQSPTIMKQLDAASRHGRIDAIVQSTDKNFMVPVGGAVIIGPSASVRAASAMYPGRASIAPIFDVFVTLLEMGKRQFVALSHSKRLEHREYFLKRLGEFAAERGEQVVSDPRNDISFGLTLRNCAGVDGSVAGEASHNIELLVAANKAAIGIGAKLYRMGVTGPRVVAPAIFSCPDADVTNSQIEAAVSGTPVYSTSKSVAGLSFASYGMHGLDEAWRQANTSPTPPPMIIVACAIGIETNDIDTFIDRMEKLYPRPSKQI